MIRSRAAADAACAGIPRESGDDPSIDSIYGVPFRYSPRERG